MKEEINQKITKLKKEIQLLNANLKNFSAEKEDKYKEKENIDAKLSSLIKEAEALKEQKQELNDKIKKLKAQRETKNKNIKLLLNKLQGLKKNRRDQLRKQNIPSINEIREKIKNIEFIIQTQAINFNREKKYMDEIKALKAKEKEVEEVEKGFEELLEFKKKINTEKIEADKIHKIIQDTAATNSELFEELTNKSKQIIEIKEQRSTIMAVLRTIKLNMNVLNKKLNSVLKSWSGITHESVANLARKSTELLQKKTDEVKEKFKSKKKLTTEDILLLQREAMQK